MSALVASPPKFIAPKTVPYIWIFVPAIIGSGDTTLFAATCWLTRVRIANPTSGEIVVTIKDGNGVDVVALEAVAPNGGVLVYTSDGDYAPGGVILTASAANLHVFAKALPL